MIMLDLAGDRSVALVDPCGDAASLDGDAAAKLLGLPGPGEVAHA